jgi:UDP-2-acetamido-3-amino-2,3-dideoxy-glucuronate N-acetyltransferase
MSVKIGVVGTGYWGKNLLRNFSELGVLGAMCDRNRDVLDIYAERYPGINCYNNFDAMLADGELDAIAIATPAETHAALAEQALASNKHVFVEKPLCLFVDEAEHLIQLAAAQERRLMVGHLLLFHPAFRAIQRVVADGEIGQLRYIYANRLSLGKIRREENSLWSFAPHDISMILRLTGRMPTQVSTLGGNYLNPKIADTTLSHLTFGEGLQAHVFVSWLHPYKDHRLVVVGSDGMLVFDDVLLGEEKVQIYPHQVAWEGDLPVIDKAEARPVPHETTEPLRLECEHFVDCVSNDKQPISDGDEGWRVLSVLDACQRSLDEGNAIKLPPRSPLQALDLEIGTAAKGEASI